MVLIMLNTFVCLFRFIPHCSHSAHLIQMADHYKWSYLGSTASYILVEHGQWRHWHKIEGWKERQPIFIPHAPACWATAWQGLQYFIKVIGHVIGHVRLPPSPAATALGSGKTHCLCYPRGSLPSPVGFSYLRILHTDPLHNTFSTITFFLECHLFIAGLYRLHWLL